MCLQLEINQFQAIVDSFLGNIPKSSEARFDFDSKMIEAISSEWVGRTSGLSITAKYNSERWKHLKANFPVTLLVIIGWSIFTRVRYNHFQLTKLVFKALFHFTI